MMGRTLCNDYQVHKTISVEVYNPGGEPVTLRRDTWLGVMSPSKMIPGVQPLETVGEVEKPVAVRRTMEMPAEKVKLHGPKFME